MAIKNIEIQDSEGNIYYPHTNASVVKNGSTTVAEQLKDIANKVDNIKIADGTTTQKGIVQLNNTTNSTSITQAATANAVKLAMDRANEAFTGADNYKKGIAGVIGNPVLNTQNKDEAVNSIQGIKNNAASALKAKNVDANGNEALASLVSKISNISIEGLGGIKYVSGGLYHIDKIANGNISLNFSPNFVVISGINVVGDDIYIAYKNKSILPYPYVNDSTGYGLPRNPSTFNFGSPSFKIELNSDGFSYNFILEGKMPRNLQYYALKI